MSLFDKLNKSAAQIRYENIKDKSRKLFSGEKNRCESAFFDLWGAEDNPISMAEAQATLDLFGSDAIQLFQIHGTWQNFIKLVSPDYVPLSPPYNYTFNPDGTVTLSDPNEDEESSSSSSSLD